MTGFDLIYLSAALLTVRIWYPALKAFMREVWEIGDPKHGTRVAEPPPRYARTRSRNLIQEPLTVSRVASEAPAGFDRKPLRRNRNFSTRRRWEGGFGRLGL